MTKPTPDRSVLEQALETIQFLARVANVSHNENDATGATIAAIRAAIAKPVITPPTDRALVEQLVGALAHGIKWLNICDKPRECLPLHDALTAGREALAQMQGEENARYFEQYQGQPIEEIDEDRFHHTPAECRFKLYTHPQASDPAPSTAGEVIAWADPENLDDVVSDRKKQDMLTVNGNPGKLLAKKYTMPLTATQPAQVERAAPSIADLIKAANSASAAGFLSGTSNWAYAMRAALLSAQALPVGELTDEQVNECWDGLMPSGHGKSRYDIARLLIAAAKAHPVDEVTDKEMQAAIYMKEACIKYAKDHQGQNPDVDVAHLLKDLDCESVILEGRKAQPGRVKCDGNHGGKNCGDPECCIDGEPLAKKGGA